MLQIQTQTFSETTLSWGKALIAGSAAAALVTGMLATVGATPVSGCEFDTSVSNVWSLQNNCTTDAPINVPAGTTLDGNRFTITGGYAFGSNGDGTNTVVGVIDADNVTIKDLTVDGISGTSLHGINVVDSNNVLLSDVTIKNNDKSGLVVNSSVVTVDNLTTAGNVWHGVNVDKKSPVLTSLTINGKSSHDEFLQVYIDDTTKGALIFDSNNQYTVTNPQVDGRLTDANYVLKPLVVKTKDDCKNGKYEAFGFKNQGQCVSSVAASEKASSKRN